VNKILKILLKFPNLGMDPFWDNNPQENLIDDKDGNNLVIEAINDNDD